MGVAPYKTFTFDGTSSSAYGVYITGEGVFNAPKRSVEMIEIPGRNGNYALDQGKFDNIEVTYKCGMFDVTESNFATKVSNFRNWICSKVGYVRLSDEYNPDEYRMAVYKNGLEVDHDLLIAGEFEITFECKPQRWLTSGETATAVANNGTLSNPTLFDASPLIQFTGRGNMKIAGEPIQFTANDLGLVDLADGTQTASSPVTFTLNNMSMMSTGDEITCNLSLFATIERKSASYPIRSIGDNGYTGTQYTSRDWTLDYSNGKYATAQYDYKGLTFTKGTTATISGTAKFDGVVGYNSDQKNYGYTFSISVAYNGSTHVITVTWSLTADDATTSTYTKKTAQATIDTITGMSTQSSIQTTVYIDCDLGEAYTLVNSVPVSVNSMAVLGSTLPVLKPGSNTITYDNTFSNVKITPRWWKV